MAAIRAITGAKVGTNHEALYKELGLPTLSARHHLCRMTKQLEILGRDMPERLNRTSFPLVSDRSNYQTRRSSDLAMPRVLTEFAKKSFVPRSTDEWNSLPEAAKSSTTKLGLKNLILPKKKPPMYYGIEIDRISAINFTRLRVKNSNLSLNLFRRNLSDSPACECGAPAETTTHFLLHCPRFMRAREDAKQQIPDAAMWHVQDILHGLNLRYSTKDNESHCRIAQSYVKATDWF